jgi:hypothetical protein
MDHDGSWYKRELVFVAINIETPFSIGMLLHFCSPLD